MYERFCLSRPARKSAECRLLRGEPIGREKTKLRTRIRRQTPPKLPPPYHPTLNSMPYNL